MHNIYKNWLPHFQWASVCLHGCLALTSHSLVVLQLSQIHLDVPGQALKGDSNRSSAPLVTNQLCCEVWSCTKKESYQTIRNGTFFHLLVPFLLKHLNSTLSLSIRGRVIWGSLHVVNPVLRKKNFELFTHKSGSIVCHDSVRQAKPGEGCSQLANGLG